MSHTIAVFPGLKPGLAARRTVRLLSYTAFLGAVFTLTSCHKTPAASTAVVCTTTSATTTSSTTSSSCVDPVTGIGVTISPATVSVNIVTSTQFQVSVSGGTNIVVTWKVNGKTGGDDTVGKIDSNGLYHAPGTIPSPAAVNVSAVSFEDPNVSATSVVTIVPAPTVTVSPTTFTMTSGTANTKAFTSSVTGTTTSNVDWFVNGVPGGNATFGTINSSGLYTAPPTPPIGSTVTVTAVSRDFPLASASAVVTLTGYSISSLQGHFAFTVTGRILSGVSSGAFFRAGSFTADGAGTLSGGLEDINEASGVTKGFSFIGTYTVLADGRGTLKFVDAGHSAANLPAIFDFVLVNGTQLQITGFDPSAGAGATYTGTAAGQGNAQDLSAFATNSNSALIGTYVFDFSGTHNVNPIPNPLSQIGEFTADGAGDITGGSIDINDGGTPGQFQIIGNTAPAFAPPVYASFYSVSSNGRGTLTLATSDPAFPTLTFSFYVISRGSAKFAGTDAAQALAGVTLQQAPNATFDPTSLNGNYAFLLSGLGPGGTVTTATAGNFLANGNGNFTSGVFDENVSGAPNIVMFGGAYTIPAVGTVATSVGRGTATFAGRTYVFYLGPVGSAVFQETDSIHAGIAAHGVFTQQQSAAFTLASLQGNYAITTTGLSGASAQVISGQLTSNGAGLVASGAIDINTAGTLTAGEAVSGTYTLPASTGRSTLALNPSTDNRNFAAYIVSPTQVFLVGIDSGRVAAGTLFRKF